MIQIILTLINTRYFSGMRQTRNVIFIFFHPVMILHLAVLFVLVAFLIVLSTRWLGPGDMAISFAAGWFIWTFVEYLTNRWLLHAGNRSVIFSVVNRYHTQHHTAPENIRYSFIHPLIILLSTVMIFMLAFVTLGKSSLPLTSGFLFGCWLFGLLHVLEHHYPAPSIRFLRGIWQNHLLHHHYYPDKAFGVSTPLWDHLLGSLPRRHLFFTIDPRGDKLRGPALRAVLVSDRKSQEFFLDVPEAVYCDDPHWIPYIRPEIKSIFDPSTNPYFRRGVARRWIVVNARGEVLGRIAAFINFGKMYDENRKVGCIGFFECTNNRQAAFLLFDTAIQWLVERYRIDAVDGPVNFGENDKYWGLLIEGFSAPSYGMNYNPPYYREFFESYGFRIRYKQLTNRIDLRNPFPERFSRIASRVIDNKRYRFIPFSYRNKEYFINDFVTIYNQAWASFKGFQSMDTDVIRKSLTDMKPIINESVIWFAYAENKPAGFVVAVPDVNEILRYTGGAFNWWDKFKFLFFKNLKGFSCLRVVVMGIVPEFQQRGLESGLIVHAYRAGKKIRQYRHVQLAWVGDFNDKMIAIHKAMGATEDKQHATYRKIL